MLKKCRKMEEHRSLTKELENIKGNQTKKKNTMSKIKIS